MTQLGIQPPEPLELVGSAQATEIIASAERDLVELQRAADAAEHAADDAEAEARASGAELDASPWALVRMQTFLDGLRTEVARDIETMLTTARRQATARIPEARVEVARSIDLTSTPPVVTPAPAAPLEPVVTPAPAPAAPPLPADSVDVTQAAAALLAQPLLTPDVEAPPVAPVVAAPSALTPESVVHAPLVQETQVPEPVVPEPVEALVVPDQALFTAPQRVEPTAAPVAPVPPTPTAPEAVPVAEVVTNDLAAPEGKPAKAKRRKLRGFPFSTVLEVLAVVLVLVFILLRLG